MKNKNTIFLICLFVLYTSFTVTVNNKSCINDFNIQFLPNLSNSDSWHRTWGGDDDERAFGIAVDSLNNIFLTGHTYSFGGGINIFLLKYNSSGDLEWYKLWNRSVQDMGRAVALDSLNNIYIVGHSGNTWDGLADMVLVKFNSSGDYQWERTWGGGKNDDAMAITLDSSNNIYLAGYTMSYGLGARDICLVKYNSSGVKLWNTTWGGSDNDRGASIVLDSSGNIFIGGETRNYGAGLTDMCLVKYNSSGDYKWHRTWGGVENDWGKAISIDKMNNIYLTGYTRSFTNGETDMCLVKYNNTGIQQWNHTWGGKYEEEAYGVAVDSLDNIYITGEAQSSEGAPKNLCLVKYNNDTEEYEWHSIWGGIQSDGAFSVKLDSLDNIYLGGYTYHSGLTGHEEVLLLKNPEKYIPPIPEIPSFNMLIIVGIIGVISIILIMIRIQFNIPRD
jgi:uncharacterized delta-60 repeat protein